jgi:hypothetical protein
MCLHLSEWVESLAQAVYNLVEYPRLMLNREDKLLEESEQLGMSLIEIGLVIYVFEGFMVSV